MRCLFLSLIALTLTGCAARPMITMRIGEQAGKELTMQIVGENVPLDQAMIILKAVDRLPSSMLRTGLVFNVTSDVSHLGKTWDGLAAGGHYCLPGFGKICILPRCIKPRLIWHEVAHAHHDYLNRKDKDFSMRWVFLADFVYDQEGRSKPAHDSGILTDYGRGAMKEDVAEFVSECYAYLNNEYMFWAGQAAIKSDLRFRKKLALLHEFGFFNKEDYEKLKPLFE